MDTPSRMDRGRWTVVLIALILPAALVLMPGCDAGGGPDGSGPETPAVADPGPGPGSQVGAWRLAASDSPYLRQHTDNPVEWYPWGKEAFAAARQRNVPILLSVGYSTCHWCHVMEHESFLDPDIAAFLAEHFVAIKVDREQRPDVDAYYMTYVQGVTGGGGWPMTVIMTPDGKPFFGGTYFPPDERYGRPGFRQILERMHAAWTDDREQVLQVAQRAHDTLQQDTLGAGGPWDPDAVLQGAVGRILASWDRQVGGRAGAPKFPPSMALQFLMRQHLRAGGQARATATTEVLELVHTTLDAMAAGGLRDQFGGGFHRYTVDGAWAVPHFEKMLYDNAQLAQTYAEAYALTGEERHGHVAADTLAWVLDDMLSDDGLFFSARDADSLPFDEDDTPVPDAHPEEGQFYLWTPEQVIEVLGITDGAAMARLFGIVPGGNFEHGLSIPNPGRTHHAMAADPGQAGDTPLPSGKAFLDWLEERREALTRARTARPPPLRDEKSIAAWNGLMLTGIARCAVLLENDDLLRRQTTLSARAMVAHFARSQPMPHPMPQPMPHQVFEGRASGTADLSDHAFLARGLLDAHAATGEAAFLAAALDLTERMLALFEDGAGGFYTTVADRDPLLPGRRRERHDGALPAGTSVALEVLLRLAPLHDDFGDVARRALDRLGPVLTERALGWPGMLAAVDALAGPAPVVVVRGNDEAAAALRRTVNVTLMPAALVLPDAGVARRVLEQRGDDLPPWLAALTDGTAGDSAAWVCLDGSCGPALLAPEALAVALAAAAPRP